MSETKAMAIVVATFLRFLDDGDAGGVDSAAVASWVVFNTELSNEGFLSVRAKTFRYRFIIMTLHGRKRHNTNVSLVDPRFRPYLRHGRAQFRKNSFDV